MRPQKHCIFTLGLHKKASAHKLFISIASHQFFTISFIGSEGYSKEFALDFISRIPQIAGITDVKASQNTSRFHLCPTPSFLWLSLLALVSLPSSKTDTKILECDRESKCCDVSKLHCATAAISSRPAVKYRGTPCTAVPSQNDFRVHVEVIAGLGLSDHVAS